MLYSLQFFSFSGIPGGSESGPVTLSDEKENTDELALTEVTKENNEPNEATSAENDEMRVPTGIKRRRWTPTRTKMSSEDYYAKMIKLEEEKLNEMRRHNYAMEEISRQKLEELKRHNLQLERPVSTAPDTYGSYTTALNDFNPYVSHTPL